MSKNRNFNYKDVDMLMASKTVAESFKSNISELSVTRTNWTAQYATDVIGRVNTAIESYLGIDVKKDLRNASATLAAIQMPAKRDISFFKTQIDEDFKKETSQRNEILKTLGFTTHLKGVQKGNQELLVQLLYTFKTNMTDQLKQEIVAKGLNVTLIDTIIGYATSFKEANVSQETLKESTKEITKEASDVLNSIYDEIIGICKIASNYYQFETLKKEQFTFSNVIERLGTSKKATTPTTPDQPKA
jgi:hypothetical protein